MAVASLASATCSFATVPNAIAIDAPEPLRALLRANLTLPEPDEMITDGVVNLPKAAITQALELAATEGYFSPGFKLIRDGGGGDQGGSSGRLRLVVDAGQRSAIDTVEIIFAGDISAPSDNSTAGDTNTRQRRMKQLRDGWLLAKGSGFRQADWTEAKRDLLLNLFSEDYPTAVITNSLADVDAEKASVSLRVELDSGPAYRLGALQIEGLKTYNQKLIDRYNNLYVGERYSQQRLLELQRALQNTPYFSSVLVDIDLDSKFDPTVPMTAAAETAASTAVPISAPVRVRVTEAQTKRLALSAGFSSNNGGRGEVTYRDANILDRGWLLAVGLRADRISQLGYADINLPITSKGYRDSFGVLAERSRNQGLTTTRQGVGVARAQNRGIIETRLSLAFQREQRDIDPNLAADAAPVNNAPRDALALNYSWTWRNVDNVLDPRSGQVINAQIGGGAKALLSDQNFVRGIFKIQQYWTVFKRDLFTMRFEGGITAAESRIGVPEEFLFRAGGAQSIRGYGYQSIGVSEGNATVGGRYLVAGTAEYVHWLGASTTGPSTAQATPKWGVAVFYDVGRANDSPKDLFPLLSGVGAGARWRSPAGPLALDLAYSVRDKKVRPVFSISIAF